MFQIPAAIKEFYQHPPDQLAPPTVDWSSVDPPDPNKTEQLKTEISPEEQEQVSRGLVKEQ